VLAATSPRGAWQPERERESNLSPFHCNHKRTCHIKRHYVSTVCFAECGEGERERVGWIERERVFPSVKDTSLQLVYSLSYFSPFVFNLAVRAALLFAPHNANSFLFRCRSSISQACYFCLTHYSADNIFLNKLAKGQLPIVIQRISSNVGLAAKTINTRYTTSN